MDGFQSSVKAVMKAAANRRLRGSAGRCPPSSVKPGYEVAIETALGFAFAEHRCGKRDGGQGGYGLLRDERAGRAPHFCRWTPSSSGSFQRPFARWARCWPAALWTYDEKYANIVSSLLGRIVVVDDINEVAHGPRAGLPQPCGDGGRPAVNAGRFVQAR